MALDLTIAETKKKITWHMKRYFRFHTLTGQHLSSGREGNKEIFNRSGMQVSLAIRANEKFWHCNPHLKPYLRPCLRFSPIKGIIIARAFCYEKKIEIKRTKITFGNIYNCKRQMFELLIIAQRISAKMKKLKKFLVRVDGVSSCDP